jgi:type III pantothenate kinase
VRLTDNESTEFNTPLRINWQLNEASRSVTTGAALPDRNQYRPDDVNWPNELRNIADFKSGSRWLISSVNRPATEVLLEFLGKHHNCTAQVMGFKDLPLEVEVDFPDLVGIDRLLAALAAVRLVTASRIIVIQAGSAVTVDLAEAVARVNSDSTQGTNNAILGRFLGGAILPGVPMMLRLLGKAADLLPELDAEELVGLPPLPGKNTEAAMVAGASSCLVGGVVHAVSRYRQQFGNDIPIVISGGDGPLLVPHLKAPIQVVPQLVLKGIQVLDSLTNRSSERYMNPPAR